MRGGGGKKNGEKKFGEGEKKEFGRGVHTTSQLFK